LSSIQNKNQISHIVKAFQVNANNRSISSETFLIFKALFLYR